MRIVRFRGQEDLPQWGVVVGDVVSALDGDVFGSFTPGREIAPISELQLLAPCDPSKIVCVAANFDGIEGFSRDMEEPITFIKPASSVIGHDQIVTNPFPELRFWGEAELGVVVKRRMTKVPVEQVRSYVLGLTIGNDVTAENIEGRDHHLVRSKGADGFCPLGPWIETDVDDRDYLIKSVQDGACIRLGRSSSQFWQWPEILSRISQWMTLEPHDVVLTGNAPDTVGMRYLEDGSVFEAIVEGIGILRTTFRK